MKPGEGQSAQASYARNAFAISAITAVLLGGVSVWRLSSAPLTIGPIMAGVTAIIAIVAAILSYRGRYLLATRLLIALFILSSLLGAIGLEGGGFLFGLTTLTFGGGVAIVTRPPAQAIRFIILLAGVAVTCVLIDFYGPPGQAEITDTNIAYPLLGSMLVIYGIFFARQFGDFSLQAKLISATAMVAIVAVVLVTAVVGITTRNALVNQVGTNLNSLANAQALAIGELISRQINSLEALALNSAVKSAVEARNDFYGDQTPETIQADILALSREWQAAGSTDRLVLSVMNNSTSQELITFRHTFPDHIRLILTDQHGALVAATERPDKFNFGQDNWWQGAYQSGFGSIYISEPYIDSERNRVVVDISVPVKLEDITGRSQIAGILLTTFSLEPLARVLAQAQFGQSGLFELHFPRYRQLEIADFNELEVGLEFTDELLFVPPAESAIIEGLILDDTTFANDTYRGVAGLISQGRVTTLANEPRVDRLGWRVVVTQSEEDAFLAVNQQQRTNVLLGILIVVVASVAAAVVARFISRPIQQLTATAVQVSQGDYAARAAVSSSDEIGTLALAFNQMTEEIQNSIVELEQRVAERTLALAASVEVSRSLSTILDPDKLVVEVVEQVRDAFDYYYVQIYLFDESRSVLQMVGGTGEAGQIMLARQHQLPVGQGLVGRAAATNTAVFIPDVSQSAEWKSNPLLPDTRTEIAVPIAIGDQVLGVLDVQHDVSEGLVEGDIDLLQSVASQVAIALRNARSFEETRKQAERETRVNIINQKIQQAPTLENVLQVAAKELGELLGQRLQIQIDRHALHADQNGNQIKPDGARDFS